MWAEQGRGAQARQAGRALPSPDPSRDICGKMKDQVGQGNMR